MDEGIGISLECNERKALGWGCLGEVRSGGDVCGDGEEEEKKMGVGEVIRGFLMKELTNCSGEGMEMVLAPVPIF